MAPDVSLTPLRVEDMSITALASFEYVYPSEFKNLKTEVMVDLAYERVTQVQMQPQTQEQSENRAEMNSMLDNI